MIMRMIKIDKKSVVILVVLLAIGGLMLSLNNSNKIKGKWEIVNSGVVNNDEKVSMIEGMRYTLISVIFVKGNQMEFLSDDKLTIGGYAADYKVLDDKLSIWGGENEIIFDMEIGVDIMLTSGNYKILLKRV